MVLLLLSLLLFLVVVVVWVSVLRLVLELAEWVLDLCLLLFLLRASYTSVTGEFLPSRGGRRYYLGSHGTIVRVRECCATGSYPSAFQRKQDPARAGAGSWKEGRGREREREEDGAGGEAQGRRRARQTQALRILVHY